MDVDLDHPAISGYLSRLGAAAAGLPPGRRDELVAEIGAHLRDALATARDGDDAAVLAAVDRLGDPHDIVAAEGADAGPAAPPLRALSYHGDPGPARPAGIGGGWGPIEVIAVLGLAIGVFTLGLGTVVGLVCAWISPRWKTREKAVATLLGLLGMLIVPILGLGVFTARTSSSTTDSGPVISSVPVQAPLPDSSADPSATPGPPPGSTDTIGGTP